METIYDLGKDPMLMHMQRASMSGEGVGLKPTHGIVGSDEWWSHIRRGELQLHTLAGVVSQLWVGRTGDFPEFELASPDGSKSRWLCSVDQSTASHRLSPGTAVEVDYVIQEFKVPLQDKNTMQLVVAVRVGPNNSFKADAFGAA